MAALSTTQEIEVVSRLIRGETYDMISAAVGIPHATIAAVKRRQKNAIAKISSQLLQRKQHTAQRILDKTHELLEARIDNALRYEEKLTKIEEDWRRDQDEAHELYEDKELTEYLHSINARHEAKLRKLKDEFMSNSALIALSKEMSDQSKDEDEANKNQPPVDSKVQLQALVAALQAGDEVRLQQIILNPKND